MTAPRPLGPIGWTFCSGIGAPEVAAPWVDWRLASEIEAFPRAVLQNRFGYRPPEDHNQGDPILWGDFTKITPKEMQARGVPLPEVLVAGTPCQAFSMAGLREGVADPRGNLTLKFVENCHAIVDARHDRKLAVLWENVPGVLSDRENAFGCFLGGIVGASDPLLSPDGGSWPSVGMVSGPRARAAWRVFDAQYFGVAQRRRRVFVVVDFGNCCDPAQVLFERKGVRGDPRPRRAPLCAVAPGVEIGSFHWEGGPHASLSQSHNTGGIGASNQELFSQGGAGLVPVAPADLVALVYDTTQVTSPYNGSSPRAGGPCHTLASGADSPLLVQPELRRLMPVETHRLQGFPDNHCAIQWRGKAAPDGHQYKALGNSMAVPNIAWIMKRIGKSAGWL